MPMKKFLFLVLFLPSLLFAQTTPVTINGNNADSIVSIKNIYTAKGTPILRWRSPIAKYGGSWMWFDAKNFKYDSVSTRNDGNVTGNVMWTDNSGVLKFSPKSKLGFIPLAGTDSLTGNIFRSGNGESYFGVRNGSNSSWVDTYVDGSVRILENLVVTGGDSYSGTFMRSETNMAQWDAVTQGTFGDKRFWFSLTQPYTFEGALIKGDSVYRTSDSLRYIQLKDAQERFAPIGSGSYIPLAGSSSISGDLFFNASGKYIGRDGKSSIRFNDTQLYMNVEDTDNQAYVSPSVGGGNGSVSLYASDKSDANRNRSLTITTGEAISINSGIAKYDSDRNAQINAEPLALITKGFADSAYTLNNLTLNDGQIPIGDGTNKAFGRTLSGDVTVSNTGITTIANNAVTNAKIANGTIDLQTKVTGLLPNRNLTDSVSKLLPIVGNIINKSWTDLTGLTKVGTQTFTVSGGNLNVVGGTPASIDLSNYYYFSTYGTSQYVNYEFNFGIRVGTISATSHGVAIGKQSSSTYANRSIQIGILLNSTQKGHIALFNNNSNTIIKQTTYPISVSSNDSITVVARRIYDQIIVTITNVTITPNQSTTLSINKNEITYNILDNIGYYAIYALGGTHKVGTFTVKINHRKGSDLLIIGDSRTNGIYSQNIKNSFHGILSDAINGTVDYYAGGGNRVLDYNISSVINEFNILAPKKFLFHIGVNDINDGQTAATTASRLKSITTGLTGYTRGTNIFYTDETPSYISTDALSTSIKDTLGAAGCIFTNYALMGTTLNKPNMTYYSYDSLHYNNDGHEYLANIILSQFGRIGLSLKNRPFTNTSQPYFQNGKMSISSGVNTVPTQSLEIRNRNNTSHILLSNSETAKQGGAIGTVGANSITMFGGCYFDGVSSTTTAMDTSGSLLNLSVGSELQFSNFTGATIGSPITANRRMTITKAGNVGIGTSTPTYQLHLTGDEMIGNKYVLSDDYGSSISIANTVTGEAMALRIINKDNDGTENTALNFEAIGVPGSTNRETGSIGYFASTSDFQFFSSASGTGTARPLRFGIGINPTDIYITNSSNIGIGTTSPTSKMSVNGNMAIGSTYSAGISAPSNSLIVEGNIGVGVPNPTYQLQTTGDIMIGSKYSLLDDYAQSLSLRNQNTGEASSLRIITKDNDGTDNQTITFEVIGVPGSTNRENATIGYFSATTDYQFFSSASGTGTARPLRFGIGINPTAIYINTSSNVGIGTSSPSSKLHVSGGTLVVQNYTVATLPACVAGVYQRATVTDALAPTYDATVVGGGARVIEVLCNGTNWVCH